MTPDFITGFVAGCICTSVLMAAVICMVIAGAIADRQSTEAKILARRQEGRA